MGPLKWFSTHNWPHIPSRHKKSVVVTKYWMKKMETILYEIYKGDIIIRKQSFINVGWILYYLWTVQAVSFCKVNCLKVVRLVNRTVLLSIKRMSDITHVCYWLEDMNVLYLSSCHIKAITFLTDKGEVCSTGCTEPFPITPHASTVVRGIKWTGPVRVVRGLSLSNRPHPGPHHTFFQTNPDTSSKTTGCRHLFQPLHVILVADRGEVSVAVSAVALGLGPCLGLAYQVILSMNACAQSDTTCRGTPTETLNKPGFVSLTVSHNYFLSFYTKKRTWSQQPDHQMEHISPGK